MSEVIQSDALINLLDRKGIITKKELPDAIKRVPASMLKADTLKDSHRHRGGCI